METAKLFMNGNSQAVRLPKEYRFAGDEVVIKRFGNGVVLLPKDDPWQVMFDALREFPDDFGHSPGAALAARPGRHRVKLLLDTDICIVGVSAITYTELR